MAIGNENDDGRHARTSTRSSGQNGVGGELKSRGGRRSGVVRRRVWNASQELYGCGVCARCRKVELHRCDVVEGDRGNARVGYIESVHHLIPKRREDKKRREMSRQTLTSSFVLPIS